MAVLPGLVRIEAVHRFHAQETVILLVLFRRPHLAAHPVARLQAEALRARRFYIPRPTPITVRFGRPRRFSSNGGSARAARRDVTEHIMADIAALLP